MAFGNRKKQLNISTADMSDEVYAFLNGLAEDRMLTRKMIEYAEQQLQQETKKQSFEEAVYMEIRLIKDMIQSRAFVQTAATKDTGEIQTDREGEDSIQRISSDYVASIISEDVNYEY